MIVVAVVKNVTGQAWARSQDGSQRLLANGDKLYAGEVIITGQNANIELVYNDGSMRIPANERIALTADAAGAEAIDAAVSDNSVSDMLALLEGDGDLLEQIEAPAAGNEGGSNDGVNFIRLTRLAEVFDPITFADNSNVFVSSSPEPGVATAQSDISFAAGQYP